MRHISFLFPFLTTFVSVVINCGVTAAVFLHSGLVVPNHNAINRKHHKVNINGALDSEKEMTKQHQIIFSHPSF